MDKFLEVQATIQKSQLGFIVDEPGRWNSSFKKLMRIHLLKPSIVEYEKVISKKFFEESDFNSLSYYLKLLAIFDECTNECAINETSCSDILPLIDVMAIYVGNLNFDENEHFISLKNRLLIEMSDRFNCYKTNYFLYKATILDARYKNRGMNKDSDQYKNVINELKEELIKVGQELVSDSVDQPLTKVFRRTSRVTEKILKDMNNITGSLSNIKLGFYENSEPVKDELEDYLKEGLWDSKLSALSFWRANSKSSISLTTLAMKYHCIPASSIVDERLFSRSADTCSEDRNLLLPETIKNLTYIKENIYNVIPFFFDSKKNLNKK
jgi:hypothetical protein